ncbi:MAG: trypsin-like peptidase domain-containing protein [Chloroflexota bacterium]|nr:trypsin-like peptidase domain-containing protein [Chloroflexota bacterium]MQG04701.1 trypsin-like serine protease [SAR202 cluster bacterium]|tara:strand:+ start:8846 stop:9901 length:1056 start_codon:yes stop_codon:yes gene_type:complete
MKKIIINLIIFILIASCSNDSNITESAISQDATYSDYLLTDFYENAVSGVVAIRAKTPMGPSTGSGFVWDKAGRIATNSHVVRESGNILGDIIVSFSNGDEMEAKLIAHDIYSDLAILEVDYPKNYNINPLKIGNSALVEVGQTALAIGNPYGENFTLTKGIISAIGRARSDLETNFQIGSVIQHDASINPGNSGGPLFNQEGEVVGVNAQIVSRSGSSSGIGFAIPINTAKKVIPSLISKKYYEHPYLGISGTDLIIELKKELNIPFEIQGIYVTDVVKNGPAINSGLKEGDIITSISNELSTSKVYTFSGLVNFLTENSNPGEEIKLTVIRDNENVSIDINLGSRPLRN